VMHIIKADQSLTEAPGQQAVQIGLDLEPIDDPPPRAAAAGGGS
jgi:hypothetical protein